MIAEQGLPLPASEQVADALEIDSRVMGGPGDPHTLAAPALGKAWPTAGPRTRTPLQLHSSLPRGSSATSGCEHGDLSPVFLHIRASIPWFSTPYQTDGKRSTNSCQVVLLFNNKTVSSSEISPSRVTGETSERSLLHWPGVPPPAQVPLPQGPRS